ncbi:MAG: hypothetical protein H7177_15585 [Rhizobacter sp.]|nr:hypothetical protein [Bacteriovorax sp.]
MKIFLILILFLVVFSSSAFSKTLTHDYQVTGLTFNAEKKYYEVTFVIEAGIYKADEKFFKCLQKSLEKKKLAKVTYEPMGLKITDCQ